MFKTSFSKYLATFVIVILLSFTVLSATITMIMRSYAFQDTEDRLRKENGIIVNLIKENGVFSAEEDIYTIADLIEPMINFNSDFDVIITDSEGLPILFTKRDENNDETKIHVTLSGEYDLKPIDFSNFKKRTAEDGHVEFVYNGILNDKNEKYMAFANSIEKEGKVEYYVMTFTSTTREHAFVSITQRVVMNSSIAVMIAAVVGAYFISKRIVQPLKKMTDAAKSFGDGDFSTRVEVSARNFEVAELGKAFNNMAESLDSLEKMRNSFLANVSHDLRTPMTTISGFIDGINSGAIPPEKHEYYLGVISAEIHRLSRLVSQLLDISRLESGERKFDFTDFDMN